MSTNKFVLEDVPTPEIEDDTPIGPVPKPTQVDEEVSKEAFTPPSFDRAAAKANPLAEMAARTLARRRLLQFIKRFRPKYLAGWVHEDICRRLERFVEDVEQGKEPRMLLMMPPRSGKSEIGSRHFPPWVLGKHPDWEIIAASHTSSLTLSFSRYIRDLMRDPAYKVVFPDAHLDPASQSVENWNLLNGGGYLAAGVGTGITGRGAHILLLDDLVKDIEAADSVTIRENTWEWYISTAYTRLAPGGGVLGIMTWWNDDDWAGRIQSVMAAGDGDKFEVIRYPAINDKGDEYILERLPGQPIIQITPGSDVPEGAKLTRPHNTAIHPARYTTEAMLRIMRNLVAAGQKRIWSALYQQSPAPDEGLHFAKSMMRHYSTAPARAEMNIFQAWDFAITEAAQNDYTVGACIGQDSKDNLYVLDIRRFKTGDGDIIVENMLDFYEEWDANLLGAEDGQIWKSIASSFWRAAETRKLYPSLETLQPLTDKLVRAGPLRGRMQGGKVWFDEKASWYEELRKELMKFPAGKHDDQIDALAWAVRLSLLWQAPKSKEPPKIKSFRDKVHLLLRSGVNEGHMSS